MAAGGRAAGAVERSCVDLVEALLLAPRVGERFPALVIDRMGKGALEIQLADPPVRGPCDEPAPDPGEEVTAQLVSADPVKRTVRFAAAGWRDLRASRPPSAAICPMRQPHGRGHNCPLHRASQSD